MLKIGHNTRATSRRRTAAVAPTRASRSTAVTDAQKKDAEVFEWTTERWKRRVEAEARHRLEHNIRGVGGAR